jgi:hypothetical protein
MTRNSDDRNKFLQALREVPFIHRAAKKVGIHPATIYRWIARNPEFANAVEDALVIGRENLTEAAESLVVKKIKEEDLGAAKFFLTHNSPRYRKTQDSSWEHHRPGSRNDREKAKAAEHRTQQMMRDAFAGPDGKVLISDETMRRHVEKKRAQEEKKRRLLGPNSH